MDVGSRVDGFVAHVAAFRKVELLDIRPLKSSVQNMVFVHGSLSQAVQKIVETDSLSCLSVLEHFGLGRYGDPLDPMGHATGFMDLIFLMSLGRTLYLSLPISSTNRVEFNAHRLFSS